MHDFPLSDMPLNGVIPRVQLFTTSYRSRHIENLAKMGYPFQLLDHCAGEPSRLEIIHVTSFG